MRSLPALFACLAFMCAGCDNGARPVSSSEASAAREPAEPGRAARETATPSTFVEGKDYTVFVRHRFLDQTRFDRPVEAFSMLFPKGWTIEGGVQWRGVQECRGDVVSNYVKASSPDGAIQYEAMPSRTFTWTDEPMMLQAMQAGAQRGGCRINQPFDAAQYIDGFAQQDLHAQASSIRADENRLSFLQQIDAQANATSRQFGNNTQQTSTMAFGTVTWPDGNEGILHVGVTTILMRKPDLLSGRVTTMASTSVFYSVLMRFPAARRDEATKLFSMVQSSFRPNPIWQQAKDQFLTALGNAEHNARMDTIRLMGEQSRAYAKAQSDASDQRMRDWESRQASQEQQHRTFVQTIREVETWKDASGTVELSSGYGQAWSRGDGSYILSNAPTFDPSSVLQDQRWQEMKRVDP